MARSRGRAALIPFLPLGYPDFEATRALAGAAADAGADILELGFPFSDPLADGPLIQAAYTHALAAGATVDSCLACVAAIAGEAGPPIVLMVAWNLVLARGVDRFCADAARAGASGLLVPDLLLDDAGGLRDAAAAHDIATVFLAGPDSDAARVARIAAASTGFVYLVRRRGVTGAGSPADDLAPRVAAVRRAGDVPVAVGFGIATAEDARDASAVADGVIVGSALVELAGDAATAGARLRAMAEAV